MLSICGDCNKQKTDYRLNGNQDDIGSTYAITCTLYWLEQKLYSLHIGQRLGPIFNSQNFYVIGLNAKFQLLFTCVVFNCYLLPEMVTIFASITFLKLDE